MNTKRAVAQMLKHLAGAGVTHLPKVELPKPVRAAAKAVAGSGQAARQSTVTGSPPGKTPDRSIEVAESGPAVREMRRPAGGMLTPEELKPEAARRPADIPEIQELMRQKLDTLQHKTDALCALAKTVAKCKRCSELASTRTQTVFGVGAPNATIMFIGEAPGADEDAQGEPFVGRAGQLLNKIIEASQLKREELYICNILRCRPPGNRNPQPQEAANCREFLDAQIQIVQPKYIVCWGTVAAQNLLNETRAVGKLRGQFFDFNGAKVMCTYHPSYLLRNPPAKKQVWEDMKFFMKEFGVELQ